jgi:hypothetical protein
MAAYGSPEYALTWKAWSMPSGLPICALRASGRRTSDSGFTGWVSPTAQDGSRGSLLPRPWDTGIPLSQQAALCGWNTPRASDGSNGGPNQANGALSADAAKVISGWPSPKASNNTGAGTCGDGGDNLQTVAGWATPTGRDHKDGASDLSNVSINGLLGEASEFIDCIDGKARRIEPGTFPLADGVPARVGRLRGYGNAINPYVAAEFVASFLDIRDAL